MELTKPEEEMLRKFIVFLRTNKKADEIHIPLSIFSNKLSPLETIVKYLKEEHHLTFLNIAKLLHRSTNNIGTTYRKSVKKFSNPVTVDNGLSIPSSIFSNKSSILGSIIVYLRDKKKMQFSRIAILLHRKYSTISSTYYKQKNNETH